MSTEPTAPAVRYFDDEDGWNRSERDGERWVCRVQHDHLSDCEWEPYAALVAFVGKLETVNDDERTLLQKYRGWATGGGCLATTRNGVFVSYPEWNRIQDELARLQAFVAERTLTAEDAWTTLDSLETTALGPFHPLIVKLRLMSGATE